MTHTETQAMCERIRKLVDYYDELDPEDYPDSEPMEFTLGEARALSALLTRQQEDLKQAADELHVWKSAAIAGLARHGICTPTSMSDFHPSDLTDGLRQLAALQAKP